MEAELDLDAILAEGDDEDDDNVDAEEIQAYHDQQSRLKVNCLLSASFILLTSLLF